MVRRLASSFALAVSLSVFVLLPQTVFAAVTITPTTFPGANLGTQTWTKTGGPYVIDGNVSFRFGSLTIEPGTVIKFTSGSSLDVHADVITNIVGTASDPIYFTSIRDDSVGGDTNGDGTASTPAAGDWGFMSLGGGAFNGNMTMWYAKFRYGGAIAYPAGAGTGVFVNPSLVVSYQWFNGNPGVDYSLSHIEASYGKTGVLFYVGQANTLTLSDSSFHDNSDYGLYKYVEPFVTNPDRTGPITAINNWWGSDTGPANTTLNSGGTGNAVSGNHLAVSPWLSSDPIPDPVPPTPQEPNPVIIIPGILGSTEKHGQWYLDQQAHIYDNLVDTLIANGYSTSTNLFTFPYDWHQSNVDTAIQLKTKIDAVKAQTGASKVDLVAHSMGGLVARQYIQSSVYQHDVDHMIFLGTPHLGSPQDYLIWEGGVFPTDPVSILINIELTVEAFENGYPNIFSYIHSKPVPSVQQLLPIYGYLFNQTNSLQNYPSGYPVNTFLENLDATISALSTSGVKVTNIVGDDQISNTLTSIQVAPSALPPFWPDGIPVGLLQPFGPSGLNYGAGDGTVPPSSSETLFGTSIVLNSDHSSLPTKAEDVVYKTLTGKDPAIPGAQPSLVQRFLVFLPHSPIDIQITAPDGKRMGKDFDTGGEFDEIPGAFYSGYDTDTEYVVIPDPEDGQYTIGVQGTGSGGAYTVSTDYVANSTSTEVNASGTIAADATTEAVATLNASNSDPVAVQQSLSDLIANLAAAVNALSVTPKQKTQLLNKIQSINNKVARQQQKQSVVLVNLQAQVQRQSGKKIDSATANAISSLLDSLIAAAAAVPLDQTLIQQLTDEINTLPPSGLKTSLLNKIARLTNLAGLSRSLSTMTNAVGRKQANRKLSDTDAQGLLDILGQIQNAI